MRRRPQVFDLLPKGPTAASTHVPPQPAQTFTIAGLITPNGYAQHLGGPTGWLLRATDALELDATLRLDPVGRGTRPGQSSVRSRQRASPRPGLSASDRKPIRR